MNNLDESVIYQLMQCIDNLKKELAKTQEEMAKLRRAVEDNTIRLEP